MPFCFTVPGRAFEDGLAVTALLQAGAISPRLVAALLMVDFPNPVVSPVRAALLSLIPSSAAVGSSSTLEKAIVAKATKAGVGTAPGAAAQLFLANWNLGPDGWRDAFGARVQAFVDRVAAMLATDDGADAIFRLAESRRREFRKRPLAEFGLTLPQATAIPESTPPLEITETGTVRTRKP